MAVLRWATFHGFSDIKLVQFLIRELIGPKEIPESQDHRLQRNRHPHQNGNHMGARQEIRAVHTRLAFDMREHHGDHEEERSLGKDRDPRRMIRPGSEQLAPDELKGRRRASDILAVHVASGGLKDSCHAQDEVKRIRKAQRDEPRNEHRVKRTVAE